MEKCPTCKQDIQPKASLNELRKVVTVFKLASGFSKEDKQWDRAFFRVYIPTAKKMIEFLGSWEAAADCIQETVEKIKDWNPEATISLQNIFLKHSANWKKDKLERENRNGIRHVSSNGVGKDERRSSSEAEDRGGESGEMLHAV